MKRLFAVLVILLAMGMFSSFISSITATATGDLGSEVESLGSRAHSLWVPSSPKGADDGVKA